MEPVLSASSAPSLTVLDPDLDPETALDPETVQSPALLVEELAIAPDATADNAPPQAPQNSFWKIFSSTFITIFLAEIGDKTQMSTLLMSAEFHRPWIVFAGAGTALVATTLIGVWVGQWLSSRLSPRTLDIAAGILLALISASLVWDVLQM